MIKRRLFFCTVLLIKLCWVSECAASDAFQQNAGTSAAQMPEAGYLELWNQAEPTLRLNENGGFGELLKGLPLPASAPTYAFVRRIIGKKITDSPELEFDIGKSNVAKAINAVLGSNSAESHFLAGLLLLRGAPGVNPNPSEGFARLKQCNESAAAYPDIQREAQFEIGVAIASGNGTARNDEEGLRWIRRAAEKGHGPAREFLRARGEILSPGSPDSQIDTGRGEVSVGLASDEVNVGESIALTYRFVNTGQPDGMPLPSIPVDGLQVSFQGAAKQADVRFGGSQNTSDTSVFQYIYSVTPQRAGLFTIPAFEVRVGDRVIKTKPVQLRAMGVGGLLPQPVFPTAGESSGSSNVTDIFAKMFPTPPTATPTPTSSPRPKPKTNTVDLPKGVKVQLPEDWSVLTSSQKSEISEETAKRQGTQGTQMSFGANLYDSLGNTLALVNVRFYDDVEATREDAANASPSDVEQLDGTLKTQLLSSLSASGQTLKNWKGTEKTTIGGVTCFVTEYIRSAENDPAGKCVRLVRFLDGPKSFTLTISYSISQEGWLRPLCDKIISSIRLAPAPPQRTSDSIPSPFSSKRKVSEKTNVLPFLLAFIGGLIALALARIALMRQGQDPLAILKAFVSKHRWIFGLMLLAVLFDALGIFASFGVSFAIPSISLVFYMLGGGALFRFVLARRPMGKLAGWLVPIGLYMGWVFIYAIGTLRPYGPATFLMLMCCAAIYRLVQLTTDTNVGEQSVGSTTP